MRHLASCLTTEQNLSADEDHVILLKAPEKLLNGPERLFSQFKNILNQNINLSHLILFPGEKKNGPI